MENIAYVYFEPYKPKSILDRYTLIPIANLFNPTYGHVYLHYGPYRFDYSAKGYETRKIIDTIGIKDDAIMIKTVAQSPEYLKNWRSPKPRRFGYIKTILSMVLPVRNCSTEVGSVIGYKTNKPYKLYLKLKEKEKCKPSTSVSNRDSSQRQRLRRTNR